MNKKTKKLIKLDLLKTSEEMIGKRRKYWNAKDIIKALSIAMIINEIKTNHLKKCNDTYYEITWEDFIKVAIDCGFKIGYSKKIEEKVSVGNNVKEEEIIFFNEEKGLILFAVSSELNSVNTAKLYGEIIVKKRLNDNQYEALTDCSYLVNKKGNINIRLDVREGLRFHLSTLTNLFSFAKKWGENHYLWFLNFLDTKDIDFSYRLINKQKINNSSDEVKKIILGKAFRKDKNNST